MIVPHQEKTFYFTCSERDNHKNVNTLGDGVGAGLFLNLWGGPAETHPGRLGVPKYPKGVPGDPSRGQKISPTFSVFPGPQVVREKNRGRGLTARWR